MKINRSFTFGLVAALVLTFYACRSAMDPPADCSNPAPLLGKADPKAGGYIVQFRDGVAVQPEVDRLAAKYKFTVRYVYASALRGFSAELTAAALAGIRCEASVMSVEYDGTVTRQ